MITNSTTAEGGLAKLGKHGKHGKRKFNSDREIYHRQP